jgi:uncharacterized protein (TIGR03086 family)
MTETAALTQTADRYRTLAGAFADRIDSVPEHGWTNPSPCEGWTARDVVRHIVDVHGLFMHLVGRELQPGPDVETDPAGAFDSARRQLQGDLDDPERAGAQFDGYLGRSTFAQAVDLFVCFDLNIHGWDLARAAGLDERIDPDELPTLWRATEVFGDGIRSERVCGPAVEPPPGADEQTRLLSYLGRRV